MSGYTDHNNTMIVTPVYDDSEAVELSTTYHLYLKPKAKLIISIILPEETEQCRPISNRDILEELKNLVAPNHFSSLKVSKTTKEFIRIEGETDTKQLAQNCLEKLNGQSLPISCLPQPLLMGVTEAPVDLPSNDNTKKLLNEIQADLEDNAENNIPPCIHLEGLPCKWFFALDLNTEKPSEEILRSTFEKFGNIVNIDIPMLDPYREDINENQLGPGGFQPFDAFLQYEKMSSAIDAVQTLQGMKLMFTSEDGKSLACDIKISVDETNHFGEEAINKRSADRLKLQELEQQRKQEKEMEEAERKRKLEERKARARKRRARLKRKLQKERRQKALQQQKETCPEEEEEDTQEWQERKLLLAHRRLESIQLLTAILDKVNDLVQVNKLEEEQMNCEYLGLSDCSVSTYSENSKVMSLPVSDKEEINHHEIGISTEDKVEITTSKEDTEKHQHGQRKDSMTENSYQNIADQEPYFKNERYEEQDTQSTFNSQRLFKLSKDDPINQPSKKRKIYETDEFINYLLNYYHYPEYARLFLETKESSNNPWCRRVVRCKGNSFQVKLQNLNGHFAEMNFMPELEETEDENGKSEAPAEQSDGNPQVPLDQRKDSTGTEPYKHLVESEHEVPVPRKKTAKPCMRKSCERPHKKMWDEDNDSLSSVPNSELKEVLEAISSTSEYFSEDLSEISGKQTNIRRASRRQRRIKQLKKLKRHNISLHSQFCHHDDLLDHLLHSYCHRLKKHSKFKLTPTQRKKPALHHQYDSETSEPESDLEAEVRATCKKKRPRLKNRVYLSDGKKVNKEMFSSPESESSSSDPYPHKGNIWRHHHNSKPKRKAPKTEGTDSEKKTSKQLDYCFAEDVSESIEHEESPWDAEETQTSGSLSSSHQPPGNKKPKGQAKRSYSDYWEWEHHFYKGDTCKS
ncbi:A-kinase anchor protein 17B-like isoform X2 [Hyla sarda]|uniref:A-kinase anchor protein 17B-like isoform X2 n=1 Tax=Hyla sarda TaxID=327740 RepID=UPI0024C3C28A|nr:A-kinase anchor protein 17B-like isoform X2 [Hyla sarda]